MKGAKFTPTVLYRDDKKEYMRQYMKWYTQDEYKRLLKVFGGKCERCSSKLILEFAHITPTKLKGRGRGKYTRVRDIKKNPKSYVLVCHGCHEQMDRASGTWCNSHNYKS